MTRHQGLSLHHLTRAHFPVLRLGYQVRLDLRRKYKGWLEDSSLAAYLAGCPRPGQKEMFLTAGCAEEMCGGEGEEKIFINSGGEFRRRIKSRPHCLSQQTDCVKILEEYFSSSREKKYKYDERAEVSCRKESFNNLDSGTDLQCSWPGRPGLEQAQCLERKYNYRPHTFTASQIVCCRADTSTVFNPRAASAAGAGAGLPLCSEGHLNQCKQEWTDWSGWEVSPLLPNIPG